MITDKEVAIKQLAKRFNFFRDSLQRYIYKKIPLNYEKIFEILPFSAALEEDKEILNISKKLLLLETEMMRDLIYLRIKQAEKNSELKVALEKMLDALTPGHLGLLDIIELIY